MDCQSERQQCNNHFCTGDVKPFNFALWWSVGSAEWISRYITHVWHYVYDAHKQYVVSLHRILYCMLLCMYTCKVSCEYIFSLQLCCQFVLLPPSSSASSFLCTWQPLSSMLRSSWLITFVHITYTCTVVPLSELFFTTDVYIDLYWLYIVLSQKVIAKNFT